MSSGIPNGIGVLRWTVRSQDFTNKDERYPQGLGMSYEDIVVECEEGEEIFAIDRIFTLSGIDMMSPVLRAWIRKPA